MDAGNYIAIGSATIALAALWLGISNYLRDRPNVRLELTFEDVPVSAGKTFPSPTLWVRNRSRHEIQIQKAGLRFSESIIEARVKTGFRDVGTLLKPNRSDVFIPEKEIDPKDSFPERYVLPRMRVEAHSGVRLYFDQYLLYKRKIAAAKRFEVHLGHGAMYVVSGRWSPFALFGLAARNRKAFKQLSAIAQKAIEQNITPYADESTAGVQREMKGGGTSGQSILLHERIETGE